MNTTYTQKNDTVQNVANSNAESVKDSSIQNDSLQRKADMANGTAQRAADPRPNNTGLPDDLKTGIESLSGFSMDDVRVHYNSSRPASVQALAYTQGTDIHVAPGQEQHLPHEAWHVAQQMAGRVAPTTNINGMPVNDNAGLEHEADVMGERALQRKGETDGSSTVKNVNLNCEYKNVFQRLRIKKKKDGNPEEIKKLSKLIEENSKHGVIFVDREDREGESFTINGLKKEIKKNLGVNWEDISAFCGNIDLSFWDYTLDDILDFVERKISKNTPAPTNPNQVFEPNDNVVREKFINPEDVIGVCNAAQKSLMLNSLSDPKTPINTIQHKEHHTNTGKPFWMIEITESGLRKIRYLGLYNHVGDKGANYKKIKGSGGSGGKSIDL